MTLTLVVNGKMVTVACRGSDTLLDVLRERLHLLGARRGCETSYCGACSVLLNGQVVHSCTVLAAVYEGSSVTTIEGISGDETLHPVQRSFAEHGATQCGYCTPGMILAALNLLEEVSHPSAHEIRHWIRGNICRCTGYQKIVQAIQDSADEKEAVR